jgi:ABC-2 type transport system permease protein
MNTTEIKTPSPSRIFSSLFKADLVIQWRNRRASIMTIIVPIIILISWRDIIDKLGGPFALSSCITIGLIAVGLMGYANTTARDREKGVFQRLRVTPASTTQIMTSRIAVQLVQMAVMTIFVFIAAYFLDHITLSVAGYVLSLIASVLCGAVFLALGLAIVGLISSAETVNAVSRFLYIALVVIGAIGELGVLGNVLEKITLWSPYGTVKTLLLASMTPSVWNSSILVALGVTIVYAGIFSIVGIKWFKWI